MSIGDTELTDTKMEIISEQVQRQLIALSVLAANVSDKSAFARKGAESVSFPKGEDFTVNNRASGAAVAEQLLSYTKDTMLLDKRSSIAWTVDPNDEIESVIAVNSDLIDRATKGHAEDVDIKIAAELEVVGVATATALATIDDTAIRDMISELKRRHANHGNLRLAISPEQENDMFGIAKFTANDTYGARVVANGQLGLIYGVPVLVTPTLIDGRYFMYDMDGIAIAFQKSTKLDSRKAPENGVGALLYVMENKYGVKGLQLGQQGVGAAESALVAKDDVA